MATAYASTLCDGVSITFGIASVAHTISEPSALKLFLSVFAISY
jgi:hypothetical protein